MVIRFVIYNSFFIYLVLPMGHALRSFCQVAWGVGVSLSLVPPSGPPFILASTIH
jgi:hypothetical protein